MIWTIDDNELSLYQVALAETDVASTVNITLTPEVGDDFKRAYIYVADADDIGKVQGKISGGSVFYDVGGYLDASFFVGDITVEMDLVFQVTVPDSGLQTITLAVGHDDNAQLGNTLFYSSELWDDTMGLLWI